MSRRRTATVALAAAALAAAGGTARAATTQVPISTARSHLLAAFPNDRLGDSVAATGDINGDGRMDFVVGAPFASNLNRASSGTAYVIYGRTAPFTIDLRTLTAAQGFRIDGPSANSRAGWDVAAGDVNGDGRFDVVVGAPGADSRGRIDNGSAFVIFGRQGTNANVNLAALGTRGFRIDGSRSSDRAGESVSVAGNINGDPRADVVVGAPAEDPNGVTDAGAGHVVFGKISTGAVDLRSVGALGYSMWGTERSGQVGASVAALGDVNGDRRDDVALGAPGVVGGGLLTRPGGAVWGVWGKSTTTRISLGAQGPLYFKVVGSVQNDRLGAGVAGVGDVNQDGLNDLVMGTVAHGPESGYVPVLFGLPYVGTVDSRALPGFSIVPDYGSAVTGVGSVGGSIAPDIAVGRFVIFGRATQTPVDTRNLGAGGFALTAPADQVIDAIRAGGPMDYDNDGRGDLFTQVTRIGGPYRVDLVPVP